MKNTEDNNLDVANELFEEEIDKGYVFIHGMGFVNRSPVRERQNQVRRVSTFLGLSVIFYILLASLPYEQLLLGESRTNVNDIYTILLRALGFYLSYTIPFGLFSWSFNVPYRALLHRGKETKREMLLMVAVGVGFGIGLNLGINILRAVSAGLGAHTTISSLVVPTNTSVGALLVTGAVTVFLEPFVKEVIFHGIIMKTLRNFGNFFALCTSSILCAMTQVSLDKAIEHFLFSMFIGYFVLRFNDLRVGMAMHSAYNLHAYVMNILSWSMGDSSRYISYFFNILLLAIAVLSLVQLARIWNINDRMIKTKDILTLKERYTIFFTSAPMIVAVLIFGLQMVGSLNLF